MAEYTKGETRGGLIQINKDGRMIALVSPRYVNKFLATPAMYEALKEIRDRAVLQKEENGFYILRLQYSIWQDACKALAESK